VRISTTDGRTRPITLTNAFWMAPAADDASDAALPEGAAELAAAAGEAALGELALLLELVHPASASAAAMAATAAGRRRHGETGCGCPGDCCGDGDEDQVSTMHHYRNART
jgi:hypothetical protein